jgi:HK97 gp10 family phage protein
MMAEGFTFTLYGARELENALRQLPTSVAKATLRGVLVKAGEPVVHAARALAPVDRGDLAASIGIRSILTRRQRRARRAGGRGGAADVFIGPSFPMGAHGHLIEFGTVKMRARPFLRPAWDANKRHVLETVRAELWKALATAARRLAKKAAAGRISAKQAAEIMG